LKELCQRFVCSLVEAIHCCPLSNPTSLKGAKETAAEALEEILVTVMFGEVEPQRYLVSLKKRVHEGEAAGWSDSFLQIETITNDVDEINKIIMETFNPTSSRYYLIEKVELKL